MRKNLKICNRALTIDLTLNKETNNNLLDGYITPDEYIFRNKSNSWYKDMKNYYTHIKQHYECNIIDKQFLTILDNLEFEKHRKLL